MEMKTLKLSVIALLVFLMLALVVGSAAPVVRAAPASALPPNFRIVAYLTSWSGSAAAVQYTRITHLNYAFVLPNANGSLQALDNPAKLQDAVTRAHAAGVKVLISVGGWNDGNDSAFESLAGNATARTAFINNMVNMVNTYSLDGVDIDWEYPDPGTSASNYAVLMRDLATAMHTRGKLLTAAVVSGGTTAGGVLPEVFGYVDFLNIMTYDGGSPHANYDWAVSNVNAWISRGLPAAKTVMGVPFYASPGGFTYAQAAAAGFQNVDCATVNGTNGCYNGIPTIQRKTQFMMNKGGIMFWEISQDATGANSLVTTIFNTANQGGVTPVASPTRTNTPGPTSPSGTNLALNRPATSSSNETAAFTPNLAVDGNTTTRWSSAFSNPQWIQVDLGATYNINRVVLNWEAAYGSGYQIQVSGSASGPWTNIYSTTTGNGATDDLTGLSGSGRYIRMNGTVRATAYGFSLFEFAVYGSGAPVATPTRTNTPVPGGVLPRTVGPLPALPPAPVRPPATPWTATPPHAGAPARRRSTASGSGWIWARCVPSTASSWMPAPPPATTRAVTRSSSRTTAPTGAAPLPQARARPSRSASPSPASPRATCASSRPAPWATGGRSTN
jgi:chitinase